jgi:Uma2 family endonuclease
LSTGRTDYDAAMNAKTKPQMNVDEFLAGAVDQPGRYELFRGEVYAMSPETVGHADAKAAVYNVLLAGIRTRRLSCHILPDGMTVRIDETTAYEPDALLYCGSKLPPSAIEVPEPVIVVEVLSPSSRQIDLAIKLAGYFLLPSLAHYLIVDPTQSLILHHSRTGDAILTRVVTEGSIALDPPGLELALADVYAG